MRRQLVVMGLALAVQPLRGSLAGPATTSAPAIPPSWADWVGDWEGRLRWASCAADGEERATLPVDATDGVVTIDLRPAGAALPALTLVAEGATFAGQQGDVGVRLTRGKGDTLELAVDLDSGCSVRATLARPSVGIPGCDRLAAWARIESQCTKLSRPPLENATRLARQREQWGKAVGPARGKLGAQCTARASRVEAELVDVGCAPSPDPEVGLRGAECQALRTTASRISRCGNIPVDLRAVLEREVVVLVAASQGADKAALPIVEGECRRGRERLVTIARQSGCPVP